MVGGFNEWSPTLGLRYGPDSYGRQQSRIVYNGGNPDSATPRERRSISVCKVLFFVSNVGKINSFIGEILAEESAPANSVPAAAVTRGERALFGITRRKGQVGGFISQVLKASAQLVYGI